MCINLIKEVMVKKLRSQWRTGAIRNKIVMPHLPIPQNSSESVNTFLPDFAIDLYHVATSDIGCGKCQL